MLEVVDRNRSSIPRLDPPSASESHFFIYFRCTKSARKLQFIFSNYTLAVLSADYSSVMVKQRKSRCDVNMTKPCVKNDSGPTHKQWLGNDPVIFNFTPSIVVLKNNGGVHYGTRSSAWNHKRD
jgi:hypothetical protein